MSGRFHPRDSLPAHFKQGSIDLQKHEPHSPKSPSSSLAADELCGHRGAGSSRRLRGLWVSRFFFPRTPQSGFLLFLGVLAFGYVMVRGFRWAREHLLWSLRNRLVTAYIFIAVVPVLLLLTMAGLGAYLLYWQLGSYVLYTDMQERIERLSEVAGTMATAYAIEAASGHQAAALALPEDQPTYLRAAMAELPGLKIETGRGEKLLRNAGGPSAKNFSGLVLRGDVLNLRAVVVRDTPSGPLF